MGKKEASQAFLDLYTEGHSSFGGKETFSPQKSVRNPLLSLLGNDKLIIWSKLNDFLEARNTSRLF